MSAILTPQEREILRLLGQGLTHGEIALRLYKSKRTVYRRVRSAMRKLKADNATMAVLKAHALGHIELRREGEPRRPLDALERIAVWQVLRHGTVRAAAVQAGVSHYTLAHRLTTSRRALGAPQRLPVTGLVVRAALFGQIPERRAS